MNAHCAGSNRAGSNEETLFDSFADDYHAQLNNGLKLTGEGPEYFARHRIQATVRLTSELADRIRTVLDFGCGVGTAAPFLLEAFPDSRIIGSDIARKAIETAAQRLTHERVTWVVDLAGIQPQSVDLIYCNGVFHHIPPVERDPALKRLAALIRPEGYFALWENNPWNPGTRWSMSRVAFDRDAICLAPIETRRRLIANGFSIQKTEYHFYFPRMLSRLRFIEPFLRGVPLGGQYVVLARGS